MDLIGWQIVLAVSVGEIDECGATTHFQPGAHYTTT